MENAEIFERIKRPKRLPDAIAMNIAAAIETGQLKPGDRLPTEHALSEKLGVARTVIREAISLLKYDGIIQSRQGVGAFVSDAGKRNAFRISPACFEKRQQLLELLELRTGVQSEASALAAKMRGDDDLRIMEMHLQAMRDAVSLGIDGAEQRVDAETAFYRTITESSGNSHYVEFVGMIETRLMANLRSVVVKNARVAEWGEGVLDEHRAVFNAVSSGNSETARNATRLHFEQAAKRLAERADIADA